MYIFVQAHCPLTKRINDSLKCSSILQIHLQWSTKYLEAYHWQLLRIYCICYTKNFPKNRRWSAGTFKSSQLQNHIPDDLNLQILEKHRIISELSSERLSRVTTKTPTLSVNPKVVRDKHPTRYSKETSKVSALPSSDIPSGHVFQSRVLCT